MAQDSQNIPPANNSKIRTKESDPNILLMNWIRAVKFRESDSTAINVKLVKNKDFLNARMLIKTNDFKTNDDSVTIFLQLSLQGLKDLNKFTYEAIKLIKEHMDQKTK
jgi:hypothetical protein